MCGCQGIYVKAMGWPLPKCLSLEHEWDFLLVLTNPQELLLFT